MLESTSVVVMEPSQRQTRTWHPALRHFTHLKCLDGGAEVEPIQVCLKRLTQDIRDACEEMKESNRLCNSPADYGVGTKLCRH